MPLAATGFGEPGRRGKLAPREKVRVCLTLCCDTAYIADEGIFWARLARFAAGEAAPKNASSGWAGEQQPLRSAGAEFNSMAKGTFGERLKRERELREVSQNELTKATRIGAHYLEALENEQWEKLPGGVFNRGFVRAIARYLGLNEETLLGEYDLAHGEAAPPPPVPFESRIPRAPLWVPIVGLLVLLAVLAGLLVGGIYGWRRYAAHRAAKKASAMALPAKNAAESSAVVATAADDPQHSRGAAAAATTLDLSVSTSAATRVRVVGDGAVEFDSEMPAEETKHFSAKQRFEVTAGNSSAVLLELNGQAMPPVGAPGASGTIVLSQKDLRPAASGNAQP